MKRNEPISHIMTRNPISVHVGQKLTDVRNAFDTYGFHHVPVVSGGELIGLLSSADIMRVSYDYGQDGRMSGAVLDHTHTIDELMTKDVTTLGSKEPIRRAFEILGEGAYHALPIVDDGILVGIVTSTDLIRYALEQY